MLFSHYSSLAAPIRWSLAPFSWPYQLAVTGRKFAYEQCWLKPFRAGVPVFSVGNLTTGGTGKTPVTEAITRYLAERGKQVVVLSRGYGARNSQPYAVAGNPAFGDEPYMLQQAVPDATVIVGANRKANAEKALIDYTPDCLLLDDGFQYLGLARDWNLLLVDASRGFGNGLQLPVGPLREPLSALKRASAIGLTRLSSKPEEARQQRAKVERDLKKLSMNLPVEPIPFNYEVKPAFPTCGAFPPQAGEDVVPVCGIANPKAFETTLTQQFGYTIHPQHFYYSDHFIYYNHTIQAMHKAHPAKTTQFITTRKDAVKLLPLWPEERQYQLWVVELQAQLPEAFKVAIDETFYRFETLHHGLC